MKQTILTLAIAAVFAACNQKPAEEVSAVKEISMTDTSGYAQFQQWKDNQDLIDPQSGGEVTESFTTDAVKEEESSSTASYSNAVVRQNSVAKVSKPARKSTPKKVTRTQPSTPRNTGSAGGSGGTSETTVSNGDVAVNTPAEAPVPAKKEGWSKAAKGTAIGAGSGAVLGAIISKNKGKGAVIGGIVGAAGGYVLGRAQDKKDGRY